MRTKHRVTNSIFCSIVYSCKDLKSWFISWISVDEWHFTTMLSWYWKDIQAWRVCINTRLNMKCLMTAFWDDANVKNLAPLKHRLLEAGDIRWHWMSRDKYMVGAGTRFNLQPSGTRFVICDDEVQLIQSPKYSQTKWLHLIMQLTWVRCWLSVDTHPSGLNMFLVLTWQLARKKAKKDDSDIATSLNYGVDASIFELV